MKRIKGIFVKPGTTNLYLRYTTAERNPETGKWKRAWDPSGYSVGQEEEAAKVLAAIRRRVAAEREFLAKVEQGEELPAKGITVRIWGRHWNALRLKKPDKMQAATEDKWKLEGHVFPALGHIPMTEFRTLNGVQFVEELKDARHPTKKLDDGSPSPAHAPRTIRSIWSCLHMMFRSAVRAEIVPVNPCVLEPGDLPPLEDAEDFQRDEAIFERYEVEQIISDDRLPEWHRVLWALKFLAGVRDSEAYALRVSTYDTRAKPLGKLTVAKGWNTRHQRLGKTKTRKVRKVPVHPTLAKVLAKWLLSGWAAHVGRQPTHDDLLIPNEEGGYLRVDDALDWFREDLAILGLRTDRRQYDSRRTFKSLAEDDGASPEKIRWVMWGRRRTVEDDYSSHAWASFCTEVAKLQVELLEGTLVQLRAVGAEIETVKETGPNSGGETAMNSRADIRTRTGDLLITKASQKHSDSQQQTAKDSGPRGLRGVHHDADPPILQVAVSLSHPGRLPIAVALEAARIRWLESEDAEELRRRLAQVLSALPSPGGAR